VKTKNYLRDLEKNFRKRIENKRIKE